MTLQFRGIYHRSLTAILTPRAIWLKMVYVSRCTGGLIEGVEPGEKVQTRQHDHRLGFALMILPHVIGGFHSIMRGKPSCFTRMTAPERVESTNRSLTSTGKELLQMANQNPNPTTPNQASKPTFFCPCCGMPAKVDWQSWYVKPGGYWIITCLQSKTDCAIGETTSSEGSLANGTFLRQWHVEPQFDMYSGKAVA